MIEDVLDSHTGEGNSEDWDFDALWVELRTLYPMSITIDEVLAEAGSKGRVSREFIRREILSDAKLAYEKRETQLGSPAMRELERRVVLSVIDRRWRDHLYEMDYLKDGIGLRAMAQRDPLVEYQREGFALFQTMMGQIREETVGYLFNLEVEVTSSQNAPTGVIAQPTVAAKGLGASAAPVQNLSYSAPSDAGGVEVRNQRGQLERAATARAQQKEAEQTLAPTGGRFGQEQPPRRRLRRAPAGSVPPRRASLAPPLPAGRSASRTRLRRRPRRTAPHAAPPRRSSPAAAPSHSAGSSGPQQDGSRRSVLPSPESAC
ncbi:hypothetical protein GCM10025866_19140 [Naasia aerilata]|uniref:SecA Wing/Scaffold domain-containing protein n=1 Tax=Naasia aerilata TaxID=1162966 RepID=A0ABN6XQY2_9MICO|nr:hypothetical protein GCM10025866_19140 [Naasia aerilata]